MRVLIFGLSVCACVCGVFVMSMKMNWVLPCCVCSMTGPLHDSHRLSVKTWTEEESDHAESTLSRYMHTRTLFRIVNAALVSVLLTKMNMLTTTNTCSVTEMICCVQYVIKTEYLQTTNHHWGYCLPLKGRSSFLLLMLWCFVNFLGVVWVFTRSGPQSERSQFREAGRRADGRAKLAATQDEYRKYVNNPSLTSF